MTTREQVRQALDTLTEAEISAVAHVLEAFRSRHLPASPLDPQVFGPLYREDGAEDRALAESGMSDFASGLELEDRR